MLNIPMKVVTLYRSSNTRKHIRITFPNGERSDIVDERMLKESFQFTESICSESSFRFGLAERSLIEFETKGIGSYKGASIKAFIEISLERLTAAEVAEIESGTWDGTVIYWPLTDGTQRPYFQIPMGDFVIESCEANQKGGRSFYRVFKAYSADYFADVNAFEKAKLSCPVPSLDMTYRPRIIQLILSQLSAVNDDLIKAYGFTRDTSAVGRGGLETMTGIEVAAQNTAGQILRFKVTQVAVSTETANINYDNQIITASWSKTAYRNFAADIDQWLSGLNINYASGATVAGNLVGIGSAEDLRNLITQQVQYYNGTKVSGTGPGGVIRYAYNNIRPYVYYRSGLSNTNYNESFTMLNIETGSSGFFAWYPWGMYNSNGTEERSWCFGNVVFPYRVVISFTNDSTGETGNHMSTLSENPTGYNYLPPSDYMFKDARPYYKPTGEELGTASFIGAYDIKKMINDFLEIQAKFAIPARNGTIKLFNLPTAEQGVLSPDQYKEFYYDENSGMKIGTVRFKTKVGEDDLIADYRFGNGQALYDMSDNELFSSLGFPVAGVQDFFRYNFAPYAKDLALNAGSVESCGYPFVEAGDNLTITDRDGDPYQMFVMRRVLKGIQSMWDTIEAVDGDMPTI